MADLIRTVAVELPQLFSPLLIALQDEEEFSVFLRRFGFAFGPETLTGAVQTLAALPTGVIGIADAAQDALDDGVQAADVLAIFDSAAPLVTSLQSLFSNLQGIVPAGTTPQGFAESLQALPEELLDLLLADYLNTRFPLAMHVLNLIDVYRPEWIDETARGVTYIRHVFDWSRVGLLFDDPEAWGAAAYGWGTDLDTDKLIWRLSRTFEFIGGVVHVVEMTPPEVAAFLPDWPFPSAPPTMARAPIIRKQVVAADGTVDAAASGEAGVALFPVAGKTPPTGPTDKGLALAPYLEGSASVSVDFGGGFSASVTGALGATGGIVFAIRPSGVEVKTGIDATAFSGAFAIELVKRPSDGAQVITLVGRPGETRIEATDIVASFGGEISNVGHDLYLAGGIRGLKVVIDPAEDGLLGTVIPEPIEITAGDVLVGWRASRGIYFESGSNLSITIPLTLDLGPIGIQELSLTVDWRQPPSITIAVTGDLTIGPIFAYAEGIGIVTSIVKEPDGPIAGYDLRFGFKAPTAYALALDVPGLSGGGMLAVYDHEYRGALALKFQSFGISAFALLNTRLPGGQDGFSLAASIFGEFSLPLGFGFFLTGVGGIIGINRTVDTNALREVLFEGRFDNLLFPADPIANAATILSDMAAIVPPRDGQHVFGPVARISWGVPSLIDIKLGVVVEVGHQARVLVLGGIGINLPARDAALVSINITFFGEIDFAAGTVNFDATLAVSRVLTFPITGDAAFRTGWAPRLNHIASIGGLHPSFPRPANLPDLRRLSIAFGSNNPKVTLSAYAAVTLNSLQFGARADLYAKGPDIWLVGQVAAEGNVYLDALIYFNPFSFDAELGGSLVLLVDGEVEAGLGFSLRLRGPNAYRINGKVWITIFGIDVDFGINHTWGEEQTLPPATADAVAVLREALERNAALEPVQQKSRLSGVSIVTGAAAEGTIDPSSGARLVQRAVPLGIALAKIGEAQVAGARTIDLKVFAGPAELPQRPATSDFVRGHFFELGEAGRLRAPEFERFKAGIEVSDGALEVDAGKAVIETYAYEVLLLGMEDRRSGLADIRVHAALSQAFTDRWVAATHRLAARPRLGYAADPAVDSVIFSEPLFVPDLVAADLIRSLSPRDDGLIRLEQEGLTFTEHGLARDTAVSLGQPTEANRVVANYIVAAQL